MGKIILQETFAFLDKFLLQNCKFHAVFFSASSYLFSLIKDPSSSKERVESTERSSKTQYNLNLDLVIK